MAGRVLIGTVDLFLVMGIFFIVYGMVMVAVERLNGMPLFYGKDQINGVINSFVLLLVGIICASTNGINGIINLGVVTGIAAVDYIFFKKLYEKRQSH